MEHTKAAFRALRESVGLTQQALADRLGVRVRSVKRWENLEEPYQAPDEAWDVLWEYLKDQQSLAHVALDVVERAHPSSYRLVYWTSQEQWRRYHVGSEVDWRVANATNRAIAVLLEERGVEVVWVDRPE